MRRTASPTSVRRLWLAGILSSTLLVSPALAQDDDSPAQDPAPLENPADEAPTPSPDAVDTVETPAADVADLTAVEFDTIEEEFRTSESTGFMSSAGSISSANARWIAHIYNDVLLREPDMGGLDHWLARVAAGGDRSRAEVTRLFLNSEEGSRGEATRAYAEILGRLPDPAGLEYWTDYLQTQSVHSLRFLHLASEEYFLTHGATNGTFVESLYEDLLFRASDPEGFAYFVGLLDGGEPRQNIVGAIYMSPESVDNRVRAYVDEILDRTPTAAELEYGAQLIRSDDERAVRAWLLSSDEAFESFLAEAFAG